MKNLKYINILFLFAIVVLGCEETEYEFGDIVAPSNLVVNTVIVGQDDENPYGDGTGAVSFTASASDALTYKYVYNGKEEQAPTGELTTSFSTTGVNTYDVTVIAYGKGGVSSSKTVQVEVLAFYTAPADLLEMLYGDGTKTWRVKAESPAHFGVGPAEETTPVWWGAAPFDKADKGGYDDRITFSSDGTVTYATNGTMYGQSAVLEADYGISWEANTDNEYENYPVDDFSDTWTLTAPDGQETLTFNGNGYHGFYVGGDHSYAILARTETEMSLRTIGADGLGWFAILTSEDEPVTEEGETLQTIYTNEVWADEFDVDGAPDPANWGYDLGAGGWGNNEIQTYTNNAENVIVEGGILKIIAKDNGAGGYTSARLKSVNLQEYTYGRVEVRAKLPAAQGTWPAIWMLGANFETVGWPTCGEIDIMEQTGWDKGKTSGALHFPDNSGGNALHDDTENETATTEFHNYTAEWTADVIKLAVDDEVFFSFDNSASTPFNDDFFFILNVAMGGTLGGTIDPGFTEDSMEVDYIRVYQ